MNTTHDLVEVRKGGVGHSLHCILVHGTFARDAEWVQADSSLAKALSELDPSGATLLKFLWSGSNTHAERTKAARALAQRLSALAEANPAARFLLVGHSHGGNIVMNAVAGIPVAQRAGVVCLATPFFHVRQRSTVMLTWARGGLWAIAFGLVWGGSLTLFSVLGDWLASSWLGRPNQWLYQRFPSLGSFQRVAGAFWGAVFAAFILAGCVLFARMSGPDGPHRGQARAADRWNDLLPHEARTLSIFHGPDEAYWGLRFIRLTSEWVHHVASIVARLGMPVLTMAASLAAAWWAVEHGMEAPRPDLAEINAMAAAARIPLYAGGAMVGTALLLWTSAALVAILPMIGVGTFNVADHLWLDISMKRTPQISSAFVQYNEMPLHSGGFLANVIAALPVFSGPLVHSRVYADPRTAQVIGRWYREDEGSAAPAGSR